MMINHLGKKRTEKKKLTQNNNNMIIRSKKIYRRASVIRTKNITKRFAPRRAPLVYLLLLLLLFYLPASSSALKVRTNGNLRITFATTTSNSPESHTRAVYRPCFRSRFENLSDENRFRKKRPIRPRSKTHSLTRLRNAILFFSVFLDTSARSESRRRFLLSFAKTLKIRIVAINANRKFSI